MFKQSIKQELKDSCAECGLAVAHCQCLSIEAADNEPHTDRTLSPHLVTELGESETLADLLKRAGPLDQKEALSLFTNICGLLVTAHQEGVHKDFEPANIMIRKTPDGLGATIIGTREFLSNPLYMSPEQCQGLGLDQRSDIYSLGCLMYEVLNGKPPYAGSSATETAKLHIGSKRPRFSNRSISSDLVDIINHCLAADKIERYSTVAELGDDLECLRNGTKISIMVRATSPRSKFMRKAFSAMALIIGLPILCGVYKQWNPTIELKSKVNGRVEFVGRGRERNAAVFQALQANIPLDELDLSSLRLRGLIGPRSCLYSCSFADTNLSASNLTGSNLIGCDFSRASCDEVNFSDSWLSEANFASADLHNCNFRGAKLYGRVNFSGANLTGADLEEARFDAPIFKDCNFSGAFLHDVQFGAADFSGMRLWNQDLSDSTFEFANFEGANLVNTNFRRASIKNSKLSHSNLAKAKLQQADLSSSDLRDADLREADLSHANLRNADLRGAKLHSANFSGANLTNAKFDKGIRPEKL